MAKAAPSRLKPHSEKKMTLEDALNLIKCAHVFKKSRYPIKYSVDRDLYHLTLDFKQKD